MRKIKMRLLQIREIAKDTIEMKLEDDYITKVANPGQFISIALPNHTLPRPISIADIDRENGEITLLFKIMGKGTDTLAGFIPGTEVDCFGPNGNGFPLDSGQVDKVLLIGGGIGVPPLYYLGKRLEEQGIEVKSILGFQSGKYVFYEKKFESLGETIIVTDDGSYGMKGFVTDAVNIIPGFDAYYACGPTGMLRALTEQMKNKTGYISLEERMGCTVGACAACVIPTATEGSYKKICHDGPVFAAEEVML
ncbi:dihydroorotate dehydrogenase electron transfer subunit [Oceanobacillus alkalisoli]|uniref:dihydroorotate dehydrogenase electron transfer subunit n=1 Tax=Oceanobacillus alkalisoli TaxID=2925113 RepID=UPI001EF01208|nr:dihydroorotate dehydrogenase electron transfer subunit [Oceanobacillus alkalisoli]MCF3942497.1 dihydroorotate dehydrogenase electron transfer subunit [Oceanobacillus alkalisoli]MCG5103554.1 dihydroorotate dehydrogenase electron transfer subunit [Oceanobacillus alkalisoli]